MKKNDVYRYFFNEESIKNGKASWHCFDGILICREIDGEISNRLYFIGDWIDEYCDLTLDGLIKTIGIDNRELVKNISYNIPQ